MMTSGHENIFVLLALWEDYINWLNFYIYKLFNIECTVIYCAFICVTPWQPIMFWINVCTSNFFDSRCLHDTNIWHSGCEKKRPCPPEGFLLMTWSCFGWWLGINMVSAVVTLTFIYYDVIGLTWGDQIIMFEHSQYHGCWCPCSLHGQRHQHPLYWLYRMGKYLFIWGRIWTTCFLSLWRNDIHSG